MKKLLLIPLLLLAACDSNTGEDGFLFEQAEYVKTEPQTVKFYPVESKAELNRLFVEKNGDRLPEGKELFAFGVLRPDSDECDMYFIDARVDYQPVWLGHETAHCIYGRFHK